MNDYILIKLKNKMKNNKKSTIEAYLKAMNHFLRYCTVNFNERDIDKCEKYIKSWFEYQIENNISANTQKLRVSAISKFYNCEYSNLIKTTNRDRTKINNAKINTKTHKKFEFLKVIYFIEGIGLKKSELNRLKGNMLLYKDGKYYIKEKSKTGADRLLPIIANEDFILNEIKKAGANNVFGEIPQRINCKFFRRKYAKELYKLNMKDISKLDLKDRYIGKNDLAGYAFDKEALKYVGYVLDTKKGAISYIINDYSDIEDISLKYKTKKGKDIYL